MSVTALYTDLSGYYDLMCADIDYRAQSAHVQRLHDLLGNGGKRYVDLACGTGPHLRHFLDANFIATGVDINQPMLDIAQSRCAEATFLNQDMSQLCLDTPVDLITCFLYSLHYNQTIQTLGDCVKRAHQALNPGGILCFNAVDKTTIDNRPGIKRALTHAGSDFNFQSNWFYGGEGEQQALQLSIEKITDGVSEIWQDQHSMVAVSFTQLQALLAPHFEIHIFEHDYTRIRPWDGYAGNALFVGIKR